jgi:REP element-mobilizing transposase RayT
MMYVNRFNRKRGYDYRRPGMYFVTINLHRHQRLFGKVVDGRNAAQQIGADCSDLLARNPQHFAHVRLDAWVIMPSHVHGILEITPTDAMPCNRTPIARKIIPAARCSRRLRHNCRVVQIGGLPPNQHRHQLCPQTALASELP